MFHFGPRPFAVALMVVVSLVCPSLGWCGTTGGLSGTVVDAATHAPVVGATVRAVSPSQSASTKTDNAGTFVFLSLAPDTYSVTVEQPGYQPAVDSGINVFADQTQRLTFAAVHALTTIGTVRSRAANDLIRPGATANVYSVNAAQAQAAQVLGGGGNLNSAYSAIASVPGVSVPNNQSGAYQNISIRGGDYAQVGYELDGVPINKAFDNYPQGTLSSLGQQEVQVYTGPPVSAEATGSSGFINQVIKTGTYPGTENVTLGLGGPQYYHNGIIEAGGATADRDFSYYAGLSGYNQGFRYYDQFNGAALNPVFGAPFVAAPCPAPGNANYASCYASGLGSGNYILGPYQAGQVATISDREGLVNLHFGIPHGKDGIKDDVQLLYDAGSMITSSYNSINDWGGLGFYNAAGQAPPTYPAGFQYNGALGTALPTNYAALIEPYAYPNSGLPPGSTLPVDARDSQITDQAILKLQYQRNFGTNAYFRLYGYSAYSDRFLYAPFEDTLPLGDAAGAQNIAASDYEVDTHTRGLNATFADQLNEHNLLTVIGSVTTATSLRDNNTQMYNSNDPFALVVSAANPTSGICYSLAGEVGTPATCSTATSLSFANAAAGKALNLTGTTCGTAACEYYVAENGLHGSYNAVKPLFTAGVITDSYKPSDKLTLDLGLRYDSYKYNGADTTGPARDFWFNAWNVSKCASTAPASSPVDKSSLGIAVTQPCSAADTATASYVPALLENVSSQAYTYNFLEPRFGLSYEVNRENVLRFSFGKFTQPTFAAFEQYNTLQQDLPDFLGSNFYKYGYTTPGHDEYPDTTYNFDASWEHQFKGTDTSLRVTPFYRRDFNESQDFYLDPATGFSSGLPVAYSSIRGVELAVRKGDFSRNGLAAQLSYTYTYSTLRYQLLPNGTTVLSPVNSVIKTYNAYTSFCAAHPTNAQCGTTTNGAPAAACYTPLAGPTGSIVGATAAPCTAAGAYANPYWNAPVQPLLDEGGVYFPTDPIVSSPTLQSNSYAVPHVAALILNYKYNRFAITPTLQFAAGQRYGTPESVTGIDPAAGCTALGTPTAGDPRYPYGAPAGSAYNATTCVGALTAIPDPYTNKFDGIGAFVAPSQLLLNLQLSYTINPRVTLRVAVTNLVNQCFGGSTEAWTGFANPKTCSYNTGGIVGVLPPNANFYNPGSTRQAFNSYPYIPQFGQYVVNNGYSQPSSPLNVYVTANIRL